MSITIQIPPELEEKLRRSASEAGMDLEQYVTEILKERWQPGASGNALSEDRERELLEKINLGISVATWKRYNYLKALRDEEQLDPEEHAELIRISDRIEEANAERMKYIVELAKLRNVTVEELMDTLGLHPGSNA